MYTVKTILCFLLIYIMYVAFLIYLLYQKLWYHKNLIKSKITTSVFGRITHPYISIKIFAMQA